MELSFLSNCELLCLCDGMLVRQLVETDEREVESFVSLVSEDVYDEYLKTSFKLRSFDKLLRACYQDAKRKQISFELDNFGGYELVNRSDGPFSKGEVLHACRSYMEKIPKDKEGLIKQISVIDQTDLCKSSRVMVGVTRFANHSCSPNCVYLASEHKGRKCVKLKVIRDCQPGEALTVDYGPHYFDVNNVSCKCNFPEKHGPIVPDSEIELSVSPKIERSRGPFVLFKDPDTYHNSAKRRLLLKSTANKPIIKAKRPHLELRRFSSTSSISSLDEAPFVFSPKDFDTSTDKTPFASSPKHFAQSAFLPCASTISPERIVGPDEIVESAAETDLEATPEKSPQRFEKIHPSSQVSLSNFLLAVNLIVAKHGTSDSEANDWMNLIRHSFPHTSCPSFTSQKRLYQKMSLACTSSKRNETHGTWCMLDFPKELAQIVQANIEIIWEYETSRDSNCDLKIPKFFCLERNTLDIFLILNSDGVRLVKSDSTSIWPVWFGVANLPPMLRSCFENIVLAALWYGSKKPTWDSIFERISLQKHQFLECRSIMLIMDAHCYIRAKRHGRIHFYPNHDSQMRLCGHHEKVASCIENGLQVANSYGVKGKSKLLDIVSNLPLTAPVDYMHQVLLGVAKVLLQVAFSKLGTTNLLIVNKAACDIKLPREFKRRVRGLDKMAFFKANEFKVWLLYVGPIVLRNRIPETLYDRFMLLSYAVRLLLITSSHAEEADRLLHLFLDATEEEFGEESFSANVHAMSHLSWQVEMFGPLWTTSAVMFESANYLLKKTFCGSVNHLDLLVERYIRNKAARRAEIVDDSIADWVRKVGNRRKCYERKFARRSMDLEPHLPPSVQHLLTSYKFEFFEVDPSTNLTDCNCFVSVCSGEKLVVGEVLAFYEDALDDKLLLRVYRVLKLFRCYTAKTSFPAAFFEVKITGEVSSFFVSNVDEKLVKISDCGETYFVPVLKPFEHD